jgi:hypothetical protein
MPRTATAGLSISKLENMLAGQRRKKTDLMRERKQILKQLAKVDARIAVLSGASAGGAGLTPTGRVRNAKSLLVMLEEALAGQAKGLSVGDITQKVLDAGYKTGSPNFRNIVNQNLITQRKKFVSIERGVYALKK